MSWIRENSLNCIQKLALNVLKAGKVPKHIAIIMDGNRRYANKKKVERTEGHVKGFDKLAEVLKWCLDLGVTEVTVYAFSLENFKRTEDEVSSLMDLAYEKFNKLLEEKDKLMEEGVSIKVIGDLSRVPDKLLKSFAKAVSMTKNNTRAKLTVAFAYTARNEIAAAVQTVLKAVENKKLTSEDISSELLLKSMFTENGIVPDLLIRTSGEIRFSDFMLWQSSCSCVYFTPVLWPEFTIWELLKAVFHYQRSLDTLEKVREKEMNDLVKNDRVNKFLNDLYEERFNKLKAVTCES